MVIQDGILEYEYVIESLVQDDPHETICEILRVDKRDGVLRPTNHNFIVEDEEGLVEDRYVNLK